MLFERRLREGIQDGSITVAFRRWRRPHVVAGHRYRTGTDLVLVESVDIVDPRELGPEQAAAAGYSSIDRLLADLRGPGDLPLYRLTFRRLDDPDPRAQLAADAALTLDDVLALDARLDRMDARSVGGPWTRAVLTAICAHPGEPAARLAAAGSPGCAQIAVSTARVQGPPTERASIRSSRASSASTSSRVSAASAASCALGSGSSSRRNVSRYSGR